VNNRVRLVSTVEQAIQGIRAFRRAGYALEEIYVLAHDDKTTDGVADLMDTNKIGLYEEGIANTFANLFRSRGDKLRSKMESLGLTEAEADFFESELDKGKILVIVWYDETKRFHMDPEMHEERIPPSRHPAGSR